MKEGLLLFRFDPYILLQLWKLIKHLPLVNYLGNLGLIVIETIGVECFPIELNLLVNDDLFGELELLLLLLDKHGLKLGVLELKVLLLLRDVLLIASVSQDISTITITEPIILIQEF